jgi:hypothetical protein
MGHLANILAIFSIVNPWDHMYKPHDIDSVCVGGCVCL